MSDLILFWHRRDLRLVDNIGLAAARDRSPKVVGVFCLDPGILDRDDIAPARVAYLIGCLAELQAGYRAAGSDLLILKGSPIVTLPQLADDLKAQAVYWNRDVEPYARDRDTQVRDALKAVNIGVEVGWDQLLHAPGEVRTGAGTPYTVYGPFWKNWNGMAKAAPVARFAEAIGLSEAEQRIAKQRTIALPTAASLGFDWDGEWLLEPGEAAARDQLDYFVDRGLYSYDDQRNFPAQAGTSLLSPALKFGAIGIRTLWAASADALAQCRSEEAHKQVQTWQQELAWREFYQHVLFFFPELADGPYRPQWKNFPWENNEKLFKAWCAGKTGYPIVDAAMRQLVATGWMHNRSRMIVASFLTKDLIIDWRWGEKFFMQHLVDGDLAANNGGWQWSASSGMDPKPLRIFNPSTQAQKFDADGEYIRRWLPEARHLDTGALLSGKITPIERGNYYAPIVDHNQRQKRFKELYASVSSRLGSAESNL
jgi:deoxyribodipyrimidine photo-lyase